MRSMPWCKLWNESRTDKKLSHLTLAERGVWSNLLTYANEQEERGTFDASDRFSLALECAEGQEDVLNSALEKLVKVHHLECVEDHPGWLTFRTWNQRQSRKPSDDTEATRIRQQRSRANRRTEKTVTRDRGVTSGKKGHVTRESREKGNVTRLEERSKSKEDTISEKDNTISSLAADVQELPKTGEPLTRTRKEPKPRIWDALVEAFGEPNTKTERGNYGRVAAELRDAGATYDEVKRRIANHHADWELTLNALPNWWTRLDRPQNSSRPHQNGRATVPDIPSTIPRLSD